MSFYSELSTTVDELLEEFGQEVTVFTNEVAVEDPATGVVTRVSSQFTTVGVLLDYDYRNFGQASAFASEVSATDKRLLLTGASVVNVGDTMLVGGAIYKAHVIKSVNPAGTNVLYDIWIKK